MNKNTLDKLIAREDALDKLTRYRRALHRIPEVAHREFKTQQSILDALVKLYPDELRKIAGTGVYARFNCADAAHARTVAFRSDIDALNVPEQSGREFASEYSGCMHACGHDGHMATILTLAETVAKNRAALRCNVVLLFQPAEEEDGGAATIIKEGGLDGVDEIYGMHVMPQLQQDTIACMDGPVMAATCELDIRLAGASAHGALPHLGHDALAAACQLYSLLQTSLTRQLDPFERHVLSIGCMEAGERRNVVADSAYMQATLRTFDDNEEARTIELLRGCVKAVEDAFGVKGEVKRLGSYPSVVNHASAARKVREIAGDAAVDMKPLMIAEDFSFYLRHTPGAFFFCGTGGKYNAPLHASTFDLDESALLTGLNIFASLIDWA